MMGTAEIEDLKRRQRQGDEAESTKDRGDRLDRKSKLKAQGFALKNGGKPLKQVRIRIQIPDTRRFTMSTHRTKKSEAFTEDGLQKMLEDFTANIEKAYPAHEWELVATGIGSFSFMCRGKKQEAADGNA